MNLNEMEGDWNSPRNNLPTEEQQQLAGQFTRQMIRRRRFQAIWLINTFVWLTVITAVALRTIAVGKVKLDQEWGLFPVLIVPWAFAFHFLRRYLKPVTSAARGEMPVADSLRAALGSNRTEQTHLKLVGVLFAIMIPLLALSMQQLHAVGKMSSRELTSMAVFFSGTLLLSGAGIAARYFARVLPQQRRLNALLTDLTNEGQ
ncbi:MAG TPA: hypothetical protein VNT99_05540 [Methylomirabilota bacterium]|nr:hypothetical protein [Methylomirabilota bacterium]